MNPDSLLPLKTRELISTARAVAVNALAPNAEKVDAEASWPRESFSALAKAGLMGLHVPRHLGGHEEGLLSLAAITETLAQRCSSSAICFAMHCVGTAVIAAKATAYHEDQYLRPIARGEHITTLSLSESGTGAHFFLPQTALTQEGDEYVVNGVKQFVTNGGMAHSYVLSAQAIGGLAPRGEFSCLLLDGSTPGLCWQAPWSGLGMRGNSSAGLELNKIRIPAKNLLGEEGDQIWYVFEVVAPYFLLGMAGTYLGVAQAALDIAREHLLSRHYEGTNDRLSDVPLLQHRLAQLWTMVEKTRLLVYHAARDGDLGDPQALLSILACKADAAQTAVTVTNEAMTLCGGMAYRENSTLARLLRDARASHVMSPTTDMLLQWQGRILLGLPLI